MAKSLKRLAQDVLDVQGACNMGGVSRSFGEAISQLHDALRAEGQTVDTMTIRRHPITLAWICKLVDLSGYDSKDITKFFAEVEEIANRLEVEAPAAT